MANGWSKLQIDWFVPIAERILGEYLVKNGFRDLRSDSISVTYVRHPVCLTATYLPEESPSFHTMLNIGLVESQDRLPEIGLWYAIPDSSSARNYGAWAFSNPDELERLLLRLRDEILEPYAKNLWENPTTLKELCQQRLVEITADYQTELTTKKRQDAINAFDGKRYFAAIEIYSTIDPRALSATDLQRIEYAKKHSQGT